MGATAAYSNDFLSAKRQLGDKPADDLVGRCFADPASKLAFSAWLQGIHINEGLLQVPAAYHEAFILNAQTLPAWADKKLMQAGAAFFVKHAERIMQLLGLLSLPYCYAAADGAMVLHLSQRLKNDAEKRLTDTAGFIWDVMSPEGFEGKGSAFASILKIRLTHAAARYYTLKSAQWDTARGMPVNQEDMAGTNLAFSLIVIRGLRKLGLSISYPEQQSFLHLWNVVGHLLGLDEDLLPMDGRSANALERAIRERHFKPSVHGRELARSLTGYFQSASAQKVSVKGAVQLMRYLLGEEVADILGLPAIPVPSYLPHVIKTMNNLPTLNTESSLMATYMRKRQAFMR